MIAQPPSLASDRPGPTPFARLPLRDRAVLGGIVVLLIGLLAYGLAWEGVLARVRAGDDEFTWLGHRGIDIIMSMPPVFAWLLHGLVLTVALAIVQIILRRRIVILSLLIAVIGHLAIWMSVTANPYYDGSVGPIVIVLESAVVAATLHLIARRVLV